MSNSNYKIYRNICPFEEWRPDIETLSETLLLGPQAEILGLVEDINRSYGLDLGVTKTYRWSPGYMDKIKDYMVNRYIEIGKKRKISTFFNMISGKRWRYDRFKRILNEIDNKMALRRREGAVFQNNSTMLDEKVGLFIDRVTSQLNEANQQFNESGIRISAEFYEQGFEHNSITVDVLAFKVTLPASTMNVFVGDQAYPIDISSCEIYLPIELKDLIYRLCSSNSIVNENQIDIGRYDSGMNRVFGKYYTMWDPNNIDCNLLHPYISNNRWNSSILEIDGNGHRVGSVCFGDLVENVSNSMKRIDLVSLCATLIGWHSSFHVGRTHPLNGIKSSFMGLPKNCDTPEFVNALSISSDTCNNNSTSNELWSKDYCDYIDCALKKGCTLYSHTDFTLGDLLEDESMEVEGEIVHRDGEPDVDEGYRRIQEDNETPEERVIRWASEHGGAINIGGRE